MTNIESNGAVTIPPTDRKSTRLNSSHGYISYAVFCLKKKKRLHQASISAKDRSWLAPLLDPHPCVAVVTCGADSLYSGGVATLPHPTHIPLHAPRQHP